MGSKDHRGPRVRAFGAGWALQLSGLRPPQATTSKPPKSASLIIATACLTWSMAPRTPQEKGILPTTPQGASGPDPHPCSSLHPNFKSQPPLDLLPHVLVPASPLTPIVFQVLPEMFSLPGSLSGPHYSCYSWLSMFLPLND